MTENLENSTNFIYIYCWFKNKYSNFDSFDHDSSTQEGKKSVTTRKTYSSSRSYVEFILLVYCAVKIYVKTLINIH